MSNERDFENRDARVSEAYRQTAKECAPESLNQAVLDMASGKTANRPGGIMFAGWVRPVAWAATIGLSLTIVLELTRAPVPLDAVMPPPPASIAVESVRQDFARQENHAVQAAKALEQMQTGPNNREALEEVAAEQLVLEEVAVTDVVQDQAAAVEVAQDNVVLEEVAVTDVVRDLAAAAELAPDELVPEEVAPVEDFAAFGVGAPEPDRDTSVARSRMTGLAASVPEKKESDRATDCDTEARAAADTWLACIKTLRESGDMRAAEREYADFLLEHSDPEAHK